MFEALVCKIPTRHATSNRARFSLRFLGLFFSILLQKAQQKRQLHLIFFKKKKVVKWYIESVGPLKNRHMRICEINQIILATCER